MRTSLYVRHRHHRARIRLGLARAGTLAVFLGAAGAWMAPQAIGARGSGYPACAKSSRCARASSLVSLQSHLSHEMQIAGSASGAYVYDLSSEQVLFSANPTVRRPPASVQKLYTATTALELMGPSARLETKVLGTGHLSSGGVWEGNLYLRGGGDPTFGSGSFIASHYGGVGSSVSTLADQLIKDGIRRVSGKVIGDESYLDSRRGEPSSNYAFDPYLEGVLSALAFNRGQMGLLKGAHAPAAYAAHKLWAALRARHVSAMAGSAGGRTPTGSQTLAQVLSPTISELLGLTLPPSDNFFAETLLKDLGARYGANGSTAAGAAVLRRTIAADFALHPNVVDGSGLSEDDRTSPYEVVDLLSELHQHPLGAVLRGDLAVAGESGTLAQRMRGTAAAGRCEGKTGTLTGVSNLAGYCQDSAGDELVFAFFTDGISIDAAHTIQDNMAITLAGY
ncbi:MAG TPA: D-alanyl-D-alanine carboxypeptidase/D-alanyl-D-alanine-endopeptidase [Solirubrobacteraceae bacterium]